MSDKRVVVPEGMLEVAENGFRHADPARYKDCTYLASMILEAALRWQRENAPVPSEMQMRALRFATADNSFTHDYNQRAIHLAVEWIRRMYDAPDHRFDELIGDLIPPEGTQFGPIYYGITPQEIERTKKVAIEAFRRGMKAGTK